MNIGNYTFEEFKALATQFHGYPAPGLLIGGYMVEMAKKDLPEGTLFEAISETKKCLPDAVQLLTLCSVGNNWLKVMNLGRYAVSLYDKYTGIGYRVAINPIALEAFPEIRAWFLKLKPKKDQNEKVLLAEIEKAGTAILSIHPIQVGHRFLGHKKMTTIGICPLCKEAYPKEDGAICRGCQGLAPYKLLDENEKNSVEQAIKVLPIEEAIGKKVLHDMTRIDPQAFKGVEFAKGHIISPGDLCRLQQMGRFNVAVEEESTLTQIHENQGALTLAQVMAGKNIAYSPEPKEGKIGFKAACDGLLVVDEERLYAFNLVKDMMLTTRHNNSFVKKNSEVAGTRIIPLFTSADNITQALEVIDNKPLFSVKPLRQAKVAILVTGTEVFQGIIQDKFIPIISAKVLEYNCEIVYTTIVPDNREYMEKALKEIKALGADLLITTGGLSVDPDDITRACLVEAGLKDIVYGMPILSGSMSLVGVISDMQVIGVPACALYFKTTAFDVLLPQLLANQPITRHSVAKLGHGGLCLQCKNCIYPHCSFAK